MVHQEDDFVLHLVSFAFQFSSFWMQLYLGPSLNSTKAHFKLAQIILTATHCGFQALLAILSFLDPGRDISLDLEQNLQRIPGKKYAIVAFTTLAVSVLQLVLVSYAGDFVHDSDEWVYPVGSILGFLAIVQIFYLLQVKDQQPQVEDQQPESNPKNLPKVSFSNLLIFFKLLLAWFLLAPFRILSAFGACLKKCLQYCSKMACCKREGKSSNSLSLETKMEELTALKKMGYLTQATTIALISADLVYSWNEVYVYANVDINWFSSFLFFSSLIVQDNLQYPYVNLDRGSVYNLLPMMYTGILVVFGGNLARLIGLPKPFGFNLKSKWSIEQLKKAIKKTKTEAQAQKLVDDIDNLGFHFDLAVQNQDNVKIDNAFKVSEALGKTIGEFVSDPTLKMKQDCEFVRRVPTSIKSRFGLIEFVRLTAECKCFKDAGAPWQAVVEQYNTGMEHRDFASAFEAALHLVMIHSMPRPEGQAAKQLPDQVQTIVDSIPGQVFFDRNDQVQNFECCC
eukprot:TRINITY_DN301_c0_g1_i7.p1 TRINITY_DN301_c0_g1~~TRINITY_DN301_c0_g1_i7.p1  ORF type:complete len:510 (-),score=92.48 TRINITY_DN301_c0_g1_i7:224-1753(-)